jgi:hypothetical protein
VILDSDWVAEFCRVAEAHPQVRAYVKNHNLGFEVPYRLGSTMDTYWVPGVNHLDRFPADFMFQLTPEEWEPMRSQTVTSSPPVAGLTSQIVMSNRRGGRRTPPYAFTEQGVAMLSSVQLRRLMDTHRDLRLRIEAMETRYDEQFSQVFDAIKQLISEDNTRKAKPPIGFL